MVGFICAVEGFKYLIAVFFGDSDAVICDYYLNVFFFADSDFNLGAGFVVFQGIFDKVIVNSSEEVFVEDI